MAIECDFQRILTNFTKIRIKAKINWFLLRLAQIKYTEASKVRIIINTAVHMGWQQIIDQRDYFV